MIRTSFKSLLIAVAMVLKALLKLTWALIKPVIKAMVRVAISFGPGWYAFFGGLTVYLYMTNSQWLAVIAIPLFTVVVGKMDVLQKFFD